MATIEDFEKLDIRVGKIIGIEDFPEAKKPSYKLKGVVNFPPRKIGPFLSEVLTLGVPDKEIAKIGGKLY